MVAGKADRGRVRTQIEPEVAKWRRKAGTDGFDIGLFERPVFEEPPSPGRSEEFLEGLEFWWCEGATADAE